MAAPSRVRRWRSRNRSDWAILRVTALPAIVCISGPPWWPGNTRESIFFAYSSRHMIMPPRPPPSVLCVVVVTTSQYGIGLGCSSAATSPAKCAMSAMRIAPTESAISRKRWKSSWRG